MNRNEQCDDNDAELYTGEQAEVEFQNCLNFAFDEQATGGVFGYRWEAMAVQTAERSVEPKLTRIESRETLNVRLFSMIIIDSGNTDGDSWKYLYHPALQSGVYLQEA